MKKRGQAWFNRDADGNFRGKRKGQAWGLNRFADRRKGQAWGFDLMIALSIFAGGLVIFYFYALNSPNDQRTTIEEMTYEGETLSELLLSEGYPSGWGSGNVVIPGVMENGAISENQLGKLCDMIDPDGEGQYNKTRNLFKTKYEYLVRFSGEISVDVEVGGSSVYGLDVDSDGNVYWGGSRVVAGNERTTTKYDSSGSLVWIKNHGAPIRAVTVDSGHVYTGGARSPGEPKFTTRKYDLDGNEDVSWRKNHDATVWGIAVDPSGNVYTAGSEATGDNNFTTRKYDSNGNLIWSESHGADVYAIAIDNLNPGYVYTGGELDPVSDTRIRRHNPDDGSIYDSWDGDHGATVRALAVDSLGNVYVGGDEDGGVTLRRFGKDGNEHPEWEMSHGATVRSIDVDSDGNVYVGGTAGTNGTTIKYDSNANLVWNATHGPQVNAIAAYTDTGADPETIELYTAGGRLGGGEIMGDGINIRKYNQNGVQLWTADHGPPIKNIINQSRFLHYMGNNYEGQDPKNLVKISRIAAFKDTPGVVDSAARVIIVDVFIWEKEFSGGDDIVCELAD